MTAFDFTPLFRQGNPEPGPRFTGMPRYNFVGGHNDPTKIPIDDLAAAAAAVIKRDGAGLAIYNLGTGPQGYRGLRDFLVDKLSTNRGIKCTRDDILITTGSGPAIDLINQILAGPGDTVIFEEFSYGGALSKLKKQKVNVVGAPLDDDGIVPEKLDALITELKAKGTPPKYVYTIPTIQNPTGSVMPVERRLKIIAIARKHGVPIFEDECYTDLLWVGDAPPAIYALDPEPVIHIGSFSKTLSPAMRLGYVVASWPVLSRLIACKSDGGTGALDQMVAAEYFTHHFKEHIDVLTGTLSEKLDTMVDALETEFGTAVEYWRPKGGIFLWLKLPDEVDTTKLVKPAADAGISFNAGPEWACDPARAKPYMRLCFGLPSKEEIRAGVAALAKVCYDNTGIPRHSANVARAGG